LAERKSLCSTELRALLYLSKTAFAGTCMGFIVHTKVILWKTTRSMTIEEGAVSTVENVQIRVAEVWIIGSIHGTILFT